MIRFPDGEERELSNWKLLLIEVGEWLVRERALTEGDCPVIGAKKSIYLANLEPIHPNGKQFRTHHELENGVFLAAHGSAAAMVGRSRSLAEKLGQDPSQMWLKTG